MSIKEEVDKNPASCKDVYLDAIAQLGDHVRQWPAQIALADEKHQLSWHELNHRLNQIANSLINLGIQPNERIAILGRNSIDYATLFLGGLRAGICIVPLSSLASGKSLAGMINDSGAKLLFVSDEYRELIEPVKSQLSGILPDGLLRLEALDEFIADSPADPVEIEPDLDWGFNLIYSSGTTGIPKGILQDRRYRAIESTVMHGLGFDENSHGLISTPLYSNTTLFFFFAILANGGSIYMMEKFNTKEYLAICEREKITHTVLVPVQYERLLKDPALGATDLSSFQFKCSTSATLHKPVKQDLLKRWPEGGLWEFYGMTEGGVNCCLVAHEHPDKLDTVGQPGEGCDIRIIDEQGNVLPQGETGEVVGWCERIMVGYHNRPEATEKASWYDEYGKRFQRSGDIGWFDGDGFLHLLDRKKDMIISGGFNVYAIDLEKVLLSHSDVADAAVIAAPSEQWGETPLAFVVLISGAHTDPEVLRLWANEQLGKAQRISEVRLIDELPRSPIGKVLKRELRDGLESNKRINNTHLDHVNATQA